MLLLWAVAASMLFARAIPIVYSVQAAFCNVSVFVALHALANLALLEERLAVVVDLS